MMGTCKSNIFASLALAITLPGAALFAPPVSAQSTDTVYADLFEALHERVDRNQALDESLASVRSQFASIPSIAQLERDKPGIIDEILSALRPIFEAQSQRIAAEYRPRFIDLYSDSFTVEEAQDLKGFIRSGVGQRLMSGLASNPNSGELMNGIMDFPNRSQDEIAADIRADARTTAEAASDGLSSEDQRAIISSAQANAALQKLSEIAPRARMLQVEMAREPLNTQEQAQMQNTVNQVIARRLGR